MNTDNIVIIGVLKVERVHCIIWMGLTSHKGPQSRNQSEAAEGNIRKI